MLDMFGISGAHFMPKAERELYIEVPTEDLNPEDGDVVGRLNRNMYDFRDAANGWFRHGQGVLSPAGYKTGLANPALFFKPETKARGAVHGDYFFVLATAKDLDEMS